MLLLNMTVINKEALIYNSQPMLQMLLLVTITMQKFSFQESKLKMPNLNLLSKA
mgnify:CR=1 FL=1